MIIKVLLSIVCVSLVIAPTTIQSANKGAPVPEKISAPEVRNREKIDRVLDEIYDFSSGKPGIGKLQRTLPNGTVKSVPVLLISFNFSVAIIKDGELLLVENLSGNENTPRVENSEVYVTVVAGQLPVSSELTPDDLKKVLLILGDKFNAFFSVKEINTEPAIIA